MVMGGMLLLLLLPGVLLLGGLVALVAWALRQGAGRDRVAGPVDDPALATLRRRYAAGELSREHYRQLVADLDSRDESP